MSRRFDAIDLSDVATYPRPGTAVPGGIRFTPDSKSVAFLYSAEGSLVRSLWTQEIATGTRSILAEAPAESATEDGLSREEVLRRERARLREIGITSFAFAKDADVLLVPVRGRLFARRADGPLAEVPGTAGALDPKLCRDGSQVAFVREDELHVADLAGGDPLRLTHDAAPGITNGVAEFVAFEELGRGNGFWWSPDGALLAYAQADSRHIPQFPIVHQGSDELAVEEHRYPFAGEPNAFVRLGVVPAAGGETVWMDLGDDPDVYLARVAWRPDGSLAALVLSRDQATMRWLLLDPATGESTIRIEESGSPWLNLGNETKFLESGEMLFASERTGFRHLYLMGVDGASRALTAGDWMVTALVDLDQERRLVRFVSTRAGARERQFEEVSLDGGEVRRVTREPGWHSGVFSPDHRWFVDTLSTLEAPPRITVRNQAGDEIVLIHEDPESSAAALGLTPPRLVTIRADDGTELDGAVYEPEGEGCGAAVVSVYGGPHAQRVANEWSLTVDLRAQHLARKGYVVLKVDNRGSANRGLAFEAALSRRFGTIEVSDQVDSARYLESLPGVDPKRIGIYGWSYGGYMTLMCMLRRPEVFRVGVAGAPVTDWDGYDTGYTERYMGTPEDNPDGYREGSVLTHVGGLAGDLLVVHGMVDENVHFRHTARFLKALAEAGKRCDVLLLPEERHMPRDKSGLMHLEQRVFDFFEEHL